MDFLLETFSSTVYFLGQFQEVSRLFKKQNVSSITDTGERREKIGDTALLLKHKENGVFCFVGGRIRRTVQRICCEMTNEPGCYIASA